MADKIYDFIPGHLRNKELEDIFEASIERVFSKGNLEKTRAFVGRRERGIDETGSYLEFPNHLFQRDNYGFEPVFENESISDRVYYDDLLNAMYNKGMLVNDHRRLFQSKHNSINLPIDADKFVNWQMYYWVEDEFHTNFIGTPSKYTHYVTVDYNAQNWFGNHNAWFHYDDIRPFITEENKNYIKQAQRPIIEFDKRLQCRNADISDWEVPVFEVIDEYGKQTESTIFEYVQDPLYTTDKILRMNAKVKSGDYNSEFVFAISMPSGYSYNMGNDNFELPYTETNFNYRNLRREYGDGKFEELELPQRPKNEYDIDVYVNGVKMIGGYDLFQNTITFDEAIIGNVYVDYATKYAVDIDGDDTWQRINPLLEYNIDNESYNQVELVYSVFYEHFLRQIETVPGLVGKANASNNYRNLGDGTDTLRYNKFGSVMITHDTDVKKGYFAVTRDDYDPIKATEFLSSSYSNYKNRLVLTTIDILKSDSSNSKTDIEILEEAISQLSTAKRAGISSFTDSDMLLFGNDYNHYTIEHVDIIYDQNTQELNNQIIDTSDCIVIVNDVVQIENIDYILDDAGYELEFLNKTFILGDNLTVRHYDSIGQTYIPPSATKMGITTLNVPEIFTDDMYNTPVEMIRGHDGSVVPVWGNRTDNIILMFETLVYNRIKNAKTETLNLHTGFYSQYESDYTFGEKRYMAYPFFKKWMIKNSIDNLYNTAYDATNWKTWNYRAISDDIPGSFRGVYSFVYNTEFIFSEPWKVIGLSQRPNTPLFNNYDFKSYVFWTELKSFADASWPIPVNTDGEAISIDSLFFNNRTTETGFDKSILQQDWEFGDYSPEELAWRRSSEYPYVEFIMTLLQHPMEMLDRYSENINDIITQFNKREGHNNPNVVSQRDGYEFKLGSKLGGFVNNLQIFSERNSLSNSSKSEIPSDNYNLFVHSGEPNRSESFSAVVLEKVSLDAGYPTYSLFDIITYNAGDIVYRASDQKYYKRKKAGITDKETNADEEHYFDYSSWVLISQPKVTKFGYRVSGYDDLNPVFYTLNWDTSSPKKVWNSNGDLATLEQWQPGSFYKLDGYVTFNKKAYVSLDNHQSTQNFENDLYDGKWKLLAEWPLVNTIDAHGYKEVLDDEIKSYNYGDIIFDVDEVAQLLVGYQEYLKIMGWSFEDTDEFGEPVNFETLLTKFLDWSRETHVVGDFVTLTPIFTKGSFTAPYGVPTVGKTGNKNYFRVVDSSGRQLSDSAIKFNTDSDGVHWESKVPVYGIKVDILDIEHAFTINRVDSYGDVIYDPLSHNRNLRMLLDCNRTVDWDGTLAVDGYIAYGGNLIPNLETLVEETRYYRDTLADQSLEIVNRLKESQIGFAPRTYLTNHFVERETQLEFYKGFLAGKATKSSINRIINNNSNFSDVKHDEIWALKLEKYGKIDNYKKVSTDVERTKLVEAVTSVQFDDNSFELGNGNYRSSPIMTSGYVNPDDVNYVVRNNTVLENTVRETFEEGDTAWIRFDEEREWDIKRLSEISEINYVGETEDSQLYLGLTNSIVDAEETVFIKINSVEVEPKINGYYNLVDNGTREINGDTVFEYLVFDDDYEPVTVEIDSTTDNSVFVPLRTQTLGITATGTISNPVISDGDILEINGAQFTFSTSTTLGTFSIGGSTATPDPVVSRDDQGRIFVYGIDGQVKNTNTLITFSGTSATTTSVLNSNDGDIININGTDLEIAFSSEQSISVSSSQTETQSLDSNRTLSISIDDGVSEDFITRDLEVVGTVLNPTLTANDTLFIDGNPIDLNVPAPITGSDDTETQTGVATDVSSITLTTDMTDFLPGNITVDNGVDTYILTTSDYSYSNNIITFDTPILDGQVMVDNDNDPATPDVAQDQDGLVNITVQLVAQPVPQILSTQGIVDTINNSSVPVEADILNGKVRIKTSESYLRMQGSVLNVLGMSSSLNLEISKLGRLSDDINSSNINVTSFINGGTGVLVIESTGSKMELQNELSNILGFSQKIITSTENPTAQSVANQITSLASGVQAIAVGNKLRLVSNTDTLIITEVSTGAMSRLGFDTPQVNVSSIDSILDQINFSLLDTSEDTSVVIEDRRIKIITDESSISISNVSGTPWNDIGIIPGLYNNTTISSADNFATQFKNIINSESSQIVASTTSDNRMSFNFSGTSISFAGTTQDVLSKLGLQETYTSIAENANFKIMRWKSVRYSPNYNYTSYLDFLTASGFINQDGQLHNTMNVWYDSEHDTNLTGWSVVKYAVNDYPYGGSVINKQITNNINVDSIKRLIVQDDKNYYNYQIYDPLNLKLPGEITKNVDYIDWQDPAKYDDEYSNELWLSSNVGKIWWDTNSVRYYRYNDFGDPQGNVDLNYAKRYWGKLVPGSRVVIKQWKSSSSVPEDISWFNTETYWDTGKNLRVTKYYYWSEIDSSTGENDYSIDEIKMFLETGGETNKFIPLSHNQILVNNSTLFNSDVLNFTIETVNNKDAETPHTDWKLLSRTGSMNIDDRFKLELRDSLVGKTVTPIRHSIEIEGYNKQDNPEMIWEKDIIAEDDQYVFDLDILRGATIENTVVILDGKIVDVIDIVGIEDGILTLSDVLTVTSGDTLRLYRIDDLTTNWFADMKTARNNFASIVNDFLSEKRLEVEFPFYRDFINNNDGIIKSIDWMIDDKFDYLQYSYLSKTRNFDMIDMFNNGVDSFKIELDEGDEYFFNYEDTLRLVRKDGASIRIEYPDNENTTVIARYYQNCYAVQTYELINMLYQYADIAFLRNMFFDMIDYMFTEKTYKDWIFKTSYIDLTMYNTPLRQYAIYQNDNYDDIIDYVNETKPYHTKIRKTDRIHTTSERFATTIEDNNTININMAFGKYSRYKDVIKDGTGDKFIIEGGLYPKDNIDIMDQNGILKRSINTTSESGGFDTGEFDAHFLESMIMRIRDFSTGKLTDVFAYDIFGKGHLLKVSKIADVHSYDSETKKLRVVQKSYFKEAKANTKWMIAIENINGEIEFVIYDKKEVVEDGADLTLVERGLLSGESINIQPGDKVYAFGVPEVVTSGLLNIY